MSATTVVTAFSASKDVIVACEKCENGLSGEKKLWSRLFALGADEPAEAPRSSQTSQNQLAIVHPGATKFRGLERRFRSEGRPTTLPASARPNPDPPGQPRAPLRGQSRGAVDS